jgi:hypothetical protein
VGEPGAVAHLFGELGVRFSFDPAGPGFSYRETRDGDEHVTVARLSMGGSFATWGDRHRGLRRRGGARAPLRLVDP